MEPFHEGDFHTYMFISEADQEIARIEIEGVYSDKMGVWGELSVYYLFEGTPERVVGFKRVNLIQDKRPGVLDLEERTTMFNWQTMYEMAMSATVEATRKPKTPSILTPTEAGANAPFLVPPFILSRGVSLLFGPGGTGKSLLALAMALSVTTGRAVFGNRPTETGPVLYLDYEDTERTQQERMSSVMQGMDISEDDLEHGIHYLKPQSSVGKMRRELHTHMRELRPVLVIVDSVGQARGGDANGSEETIKMFATLNSLDTSVLGIDHMTKDDRRSGKMLTPYGSVYTENSVRLAWAVKAAESSTSTERYLNLIQTKRNSVAAHEPLGAQMTFTNEGMEFNGTMQPILRKVIVSLSDRWWEKAEGSTIDRIVDSLDSHGNKTISELASLLDIPKDTVKRTLDRYLDKKVSKVTTTKPFVWGLMASKEHEQDNGTDE